MSTHYSLNVSQDTALQLLTARAPTAEDFPLSVEG